MVESINLVKGQKVDLTKDNESLNTVTLGLGWDVNKGNSGSFDLDAFAILLRDGKYKQNKDIVFFGNLKNDGVKHNGDNITGEGDGDDEQIEVKLSDVPADVDQILFAVNIYQGASKRQNFGMIQNAFIRLVDKDKGTELMKYDLQEDYSIFTVVVFGKMYRHNGDWKFQSLGEGKNGDINQVANLYA